MTSTRFAVFALTETGTKLARRIGKLAAGDVTVFVPEKYLLPDETNEKCFGRGQFGTTFTDVFDHFDCLVCVMATGIVVRSVSKVLQDKLTDPAVLVVDEQAHHVISLLSGHMGGANQWTAKIAEQLGSDPVITTATDTEGVQALDVLARIYHGWYAEFKTTTKRINGRLAAHEPVELYIEPNLVIPSVSLKGFGRLKQVADRDEKVPLVVISDRTHFDKQADCIQLIPKINVLGVGCRKDVTVGMMQAAFSQFCEERQLAWQSVDRVASIDVKAHETAVHYLGKIVGKQPQFYSARELSKTAIHYPQSAFVKKTVGVGSVAESSSELASGNRVIGDRFSADEITFALSRLTIKES